MVPAPFGAGRSEEAVARSGADKDVGEVDPADAFEDQRVAVAGKGQIAIDEAPALIVGHDQQNVGPGVVLDRAARRCAEPRS